MGLEKGFDLLYREILRVWISLSACRAVVLLAFTVLLDLSEPGWHLSQPLADGLLAEDLLAILQDQRL